MSIGIDLDSLERPQTHNKEAPFKFCTPMVFMLTVALVNLSDPGGATFKAAFTHGLWYSEKGEALLRGVLTLRYFSHAQPASLWKAGFLHNLLMVWQSTPIVVPRSRISRSAAPFS